MQKQNFWVRKNFPRNCNALFLPNTKEESTVSKISSNAFRKGLNKISYIGVFVSLFNFRFFDKFICKLNISAYQVLADVVVDRFCKKSRLLYKVPNLLTEPPHVQSADCLSIKSDTFF